MDYTLRRFTPEDGYSFYQYASNPLVRDNMNEGFPDSIGACKRLVTQFSQSDEQYQCVRAIEVGFACVGSVGLFIQSGDMQHSAEAAYWLAEPFWGNGIMPEALRTLCAYMFEHYDIVRIFAQPYARNTASRKVLYKTGFQQEGYLRQGVYRERENAVYDRCIYALLREDFA